jgi:hypothetical protein
VSSSRRKMEVVKILLFMAFVCSSVFAVNIKSKKG